MEKYVCTVCGYVYDPEENDGVKFEDLADDYVCPLCGVGKICLKNNNEPLLFVKVKCRKEVLCLN